MMKIRFNSNQRARIYDKLILPLISYIKTFPPRYEDDFVTRFAHFFRSQTINLGNLLIQTQSKTIHQKPYAYFILKNKKRHCELGDIVFVVKYNHQNSIERRVTFIQSKFVHPIKSRSPRLKINPRQLKLYKRWPNFHLARSHDHTKRVYNLRSLNKSLGSYTIQHYLGSSWGLSADRLDVILGNHQSIYYHKFLESVSDYETLSSILLKAIVRQWGNSVDSHSDLTDLLKKIYEIFNYQDPPEDWEVHDEFLPEKGISALLEITVRIEGE